MKEFSTNLARTIVPDNYRYIDQIEEGDIDVVCRGRDFLISRQIMAIVSLGNNTLTSEIVEKVRQQIKKKYNGIFVFREIGLQIVILVNDFSTADLALLKADKYASGAVIIQGLHIVSINQRKVSSFNSKWGEMTFGKGKIINSLLEAQLKA